MANYELWVTLYCGQKVHPGNVHIGVLIKLFYPGWSWYNTARQSNHIINIVKWPPGQSNTVLCQCYLNVSLA